VLESAESVSVVQEPAASLVLESAESVSVVLEPAASRVQVLQV
jgi:hypothetical protein